MLGEVLGEEDGGEMVVYVSGSIFLPWQADPAQICLGNIWLAWANSAPTNFTASVKISYCILKMLVLKSQWSKHAEFGCKPTVHI